MQDICYCIFLFLENMLIGKYCLEREKKSRTKTYYSHSPVALAWFSEAWYNRPKLYNSNPNLHSASFTCKSMKNGNILILLSRYSIQHEEKQFFLLYIVFADTSSQQFFSCFSSTITANKENATGHYPLYCGRRG